jgi:hypothetical protein
MFVHTDPADRPAGIFGGTTTLVAGPETVVRDMFLAFSAR